MSKYLTGRTYTITYTGAITAQFASNGINPQVYTPASFGAGGNIGWSLEFDIVTSYPIVRMNLTATAGGGGDSDYVDFPWGEEDITGTYEASVAVEEVLEITGKLDSSISPYYANIIDAPAETHFRLYLRAMPGGTRSVTVTAGTLSATATETIPILTDEEVSPGGGVSIAGTNIAGYRSYYEQEDGSWMMMSNYEPGDAIAAGVTIACSMGLSTTSYYRAASGATATAGTGAAITLPAAMWGAWDFFYYSGSERPGITQAKPAEPAYGGGHTGSCSWSSTPPTSYSIDGQLVTPSGGYPGSLTVGVSGMPTGSPIAASSGFSTSFTQASYSASSTLNGVAQTGESLGQHAPIALSLGGLADAGEDPSQSRLPMQGWAVNPISISQAETADVPLLADSGHWSAGANTTLTFPASVLRAVVSGGAGAITGAFDAIERRQFGSYAYLRVKCRSVGSADKPLTLAIRGKQWNLTTGAADAWVERDIDLLCPDNRTATVDAQDTRWPATSYDNTADYPTEELVESAQGPLWGVGDTGDIAFTGLADGATYEVESLTLVRKTYSRVSVSPAFYNSRMRYSLSQNFLDKPWPVKAQQDRQVSESGTYTQYYTRPFVVGDTDGKRSLEEPDMTYQRTEGVPSGVVSYSFTPLTCAQLVGLINGGHNPGWTATDNLPSPGAYYDYAPLADYLCSDLPAVGAFAAGGGAFNGSGFSVCMDADVSIGIPFIVVPLFDSLTVWPGCSDPFNHGGSGVSIKASRCLRGAAQGVAISTTGARTAGVVVNLRHDPAGANTDGGSGTTQVGQAEYATGSPNAYGYTEDTSAGYSMYNPHEFTANADNNEDAPSAIYYPRHRRRVAFIVDPADAWLSVDTNKMSMHLRAYVHSGNIWFGSSSANAQAWSDRDSGVAGDMPAIAYEPLSQMVRVHLDYVSGGDVLTRTTQNEGRSVSAPVTLHTGATHPAILSVRAMPQVLIHLACSGGGIVARRFSGAGEALGAAYSVVASGVTPSTIATGYFQHAGDTTHLIAYQGGSDIELCSSANGIAWSAPSTVITGALLPAMATPRGPGGVQYIYAWRAGAIVGIRRDGYGNLLGSEFTAVASGVDEGPIAARWYPALGDDYILLAYRAGGDIVNKVSRNGVTFA